MMEEELREQRKAGSEEKRRYRREEPKSPDTTMEMLVPRSLRFEPPDPLHVSSFFNSFLGSRFLAPNFFLSLGYTLWQLLQQSQCHTALIQLRAYAKAR